MLKSEADLNLSNEEMFKDTLTLGEYVFKLVKEKKTDSDEFKTLINLYGKERLRNLYKETLEKCQSLIEKKNQNQNF